MASFANAHSILPSQPNFHPVQVWPPPPTKLTKFPSPMRITQLLQVKFHVSDPIRGAAGNNFTAARQNTTPSERNVSDMMSSDFLLTKASESDKEQRKVILPPRICTLRAFGKNGEGVMRLDPETMSAFLRSLADSIEISARIRDWEILSGRLAMIVFASALLLEALTGHSVFQKMDTRRLGEIALVCMMAVLGAAGFAFAWKAKARVADSMSRLASKGCKNLVNSLIDNIVDGLFFDEE